MNTCRGLILTLGLALVAYDVFAAPNVLRKNGDCKLQVCDYFRGNGVMKVPISDSEVETTFKLLGDDNWFGSFAVVANPEVRNKSQRHLEVACHVAFFDKAGELVASASQSADLKAGEVTSFGSCVGKISRKEFDRISSYKIVIYVEDSKPNK